MRICPFEKKFFFLPSDENFSKSGHFFHSGPDEDFQDSPEPNAPTELTSDTTDRTELTGPEVDAPEKTPSSPPPPSSASGNTQILKEHIYIIKSFLVIYNYDDQNTLEGFVCACIFQKNFVFFFFLSSI